MTITITKENWKELITLDQVEEILGQTIKKDSSNKLITFLCLLSSYTQSSQFNISYNAPSSSGKSYIPLEIAKFFPSEDVLEIGYCSPTAFFHDVGKYDKETKTCNIDLSHKIIIFLDQPHAQLLSRLRPILSHDANQINLKITDKDQRFGLRTKNVSIKGFPSVIFCTAGLGIDEQEATRFILLSPDIDQVKLEQSIYEVAKKESDGEAYNDALNNSPLRQTLVQRIFAIKKENIRTIKINSENEIVERFLSTKTLLKPRHQRDIKRIFSIIKSIALLNCWHRECVNHSITANNDDINAAFKLWESIAKSQELNLPGYIYDIYDKVILPTWSDKTSSSKHTQGLTRQEIMKAHFATYGRLPDEYQLRQQILPMLEMAGLIQQIPDLNDRRKILIKPSDNNSESTIGVHKEK